MKKISLLLALFVCLGLGKTFAGSFNIINMTGCTFTITTGFGSITGPSSTVYPFSFGPVTINPGPNPFANPTLLPGFTSPAPAGLQASGCVNHTRMMGPGGVSFPLGAAYPSYTSTNNPACYNGNNYVMNWTTGSNGCDVVSLIF